MSTWEKKIIAGVSETKRSQTTGGVWRLAAVLVLLADVILQSAGGVQQPGPGQWHSKTGCLKLPRLGTSSPGAPRPRVQPAPSPEERITDLARETVGCSQLNTSPPPFLWPDPLFNNLNYRNSPPGAFPEERALFLLAWFCVSEGIESAPSALLMKLGLCSQCAKFNPMCFSKIAKAKRDATLTWTTNGCNVHKEDVHIFFMTEQNWQSSQNAKLLMNHIHLRHRVLRATKRNTEAWGFAILLCGQNVLFVKR